MLTFVYSFSRIVDVEEIHTFTKNKIWKEGKNIMRKMMTKEVTKTTVKVAKMEMVDGQPKAVTLPDVVLLGNVSMEKAQKQVDKEFGEKVTVFGVQPDTTVYEMPVDEFIKIATIKQDEVEKPSEIPQSVDEVKPVNQQA